MDKMTALTESNIQLSSNIEHLVKETSKTTNRTDKLEDKVTENTKDIAILKSKGQWQEWVGRAVVTGIVGIVIGAIVYVIQIKG